MQLNTGRKVRLGWHWHIHIRVLLSGAFWMCDRIFQMDYKIPICPSLSTEVPVSKRITQISGFSRNFRYPLWTTVLGSWWKPGFESRKQLELPGRWILSFTIRENLFNPEYLWTYTAYQIDNLIQWTPELLLFGLQRTCKKCGAAAWKYLQKRISGLYGFKWIFPVWV